MKKILSALLALLTVGSLLVGCSGGDTTSTDNTSAADTTTAEAEVTTEAKETLDLEVKDWEGKQFRVIGRTHDVNTQFQNFEIDAESVTGDLINDAVYERNSKISETYNVEVVQILDKAPKDLIQKYVNSQEDAFELSFSTLGEIGSLSAGGYFISMEDIPNVDYSKPWWYENVNDAISIDGKFYYTTSAFNLMDKNRMYILIFNKDMAEEYNFGNMYEHVDNGEFTVDNVLTYSQAVAGDIDGDGAMTDIDQYGFVMDSYNGFIVAVQSMGNKFVEKDSNDLPELVMNTDKMISSIDKALDMCLNKETSLTCEWYAGKVDYDHWRVSSSAFKEERALFATCFVNWPKGLKTYSADCDFAYGVLPFPKYDEAQENYISVPDPSWVALFAIPKTNSDLDFTGYMLEVLSYLSYESVLPVYYQTVTKDKYTYDEESGRMLDMMFANPQYDLGMIYQWGNLRVMYSEIASAGENTFASKYASFETAALAAMEETVDTFLSLD